MDDLTPSAAASLDQALMPTQSTCLPTHWASAASKQPQTLAASGLLQHVAQLNAMARRHPLLLGVALVSVVLFMASLQWPLLPTLLVYYPSLLIPDADVPGEYMFHHKHEGIPNGYRVPRTWQVPQYCPIEVTKPSNIKYLVINMDRSPDRLEKMRHAFQEAGLPPFHRIVGVDPVLHREEIDFPHPKGLAPGNIGTFASHRACWKHMVNDSNHEWFVVMEDDAFPVSREALTDFPLVPDACDKLLFGSVSKLEPVCQSSPVNWVLSGHGDWGYLMHKDAARKWLDYTTRVGYRDGLMDVVGIAQFHVCWHRPYTEVIQSHNYTASLRLKMNDQKSLGSP